MRTETRTRTQEERRRDAEAALLWSAATLIGEHGMAGTTLAAVGAAAGYSRGIASHHFGTRAALIERLAGLTHQQFLQNSLAAASGDEVDQVLALVHSYIIAMRPGPRSEPFTRAFIVMWGESAAATAELRPVFATSDERSRAVIADLLRAGQAHGRVREGVDPDAIAVILLGQLRGVALQVLVTPEAIDVDAIGATMIAGTRAFISPEVTC